MTRGHGPNTGNDRAKDFDETKNAYNIDRTFVRCRCRMLSTPSFIERKKVISWGGASPTDVNSGAIVESLCVCRVRFK